MRIAIFSDTFLPQINGVANVAYQSAKTLAERGHQVMVFTVMPNRAEARAVSAREKFTVFTIPSFAVPAYPGERCSWLMGTALNRLRKFRPEVIHVHTPFMVGWEAILEGKLLGIPIIGTHHTFYDHYLKHVKADYKWSRKFSWKYTVGFYNRCDVVLSPSQSLADAMVRAGLKRPIATLQNFIDTDFFRPVDNKETQEKIKRVFGVGGPSLVYMGRLSYEKNIDDVINAFAIAHKKDQNLKLMIVGDGPEKINLIKLAVDLGVKSNVIFTGFLKGEELVRVLQANDIFLTASRSENMPLSLLEAMAVGLPFVTVREKGLVEILKDGVNGYFAETGSAGDMANKALKLLSEPKLLKKFSDASRSLAMEYSKDTVMSKLEKIYERAIAQKRIRLEIKK
jgi:1,2-diacylglycerol 3-alpha-glucosyltransferase